MCVWGGGVCIVAPYLVFMGGVGLFVVYFPLVILCFYLQVWAVRIRNLFGVRSIPMKNIIVFLPTLNGDPFLCFVPGVSNIFNWVFMCRFLYLLVHLFIVLYFSSLFEALSSNSSIPDTYKVG